MPRTQVVFYQDANGKVPLLEWLDDLPSKVQLKCIAKIERLKEEGHDLRRPEADFLRDKIYELRVGFQGGNYRMLYFFHGNIAAVVSHGIVKEREVPFKEIEIAIKRRAEFEHNPEAHRFKDEP